MYIVTHIHCVPYSLCLISPASHSCCLIHPVPYSPSHIYLLFSIFTVSHICCVPYTQCLRFVESTILFSGLNHVSGLLMSSMNDTAQYLSANLLNEYVQLEVDTIPILFATCLIQDNAPDMNKPHELTSPSHLIGPLCQT